MRLLCDHLPTAAHTPQQLLLSHRRRAPSPRLACNSFGAPASSRPHPCRQPAVLHSSATQLARAACKRCSPRVSASGLCEVASPDSVAGGDAQGLAEVLGRDCDDLQEQVYDLLTYAVVQPLAPEPTEHDRERLETNFNSPYWDEHDSHPQGERGGASASGAGGPTSAAAATRAPALRSGTSAQGRQSHVPRAARSAQLPQAPGLASISAPEKPSDVISSNVEKLERALADDPSQRSSVAAVRKARMAQWGKTKGAPLNTAPRATRSTRSGKKRSTRSSPVGGVLDIFLQHVRRFQLLSADEEKVLGRHVQTLKGLKTVAAELKEKLGREPTVAECAAAADLTPAELRQRYTIGSESKQQMVNCNLRLVLSIARKYRFRGVPVEDLIAEGIAGLGTGIERWDPERGFKVSTYVHWWIRQAVDRCAKEHSRVIRLPAHMYDLISRIRRTEVLLMSELNRRATLSEVADHMGITVKRLQLLNRAGRLPTSTSAPVGKEAEGDTVEDGIIDDSETPAGQTSMHRALEADMDNVLHTLSPRECGVLRLRYGLDDGEEKTLEEIGVRYKVTRERIRQIECKALRKLKQPMRAGMLESYRDAFEADLPLTERKGILRSG